MGYIDIPIYQYNPYGYPEYYLDDVIKWFTGVHTGSRIDFAFSGGTLVLRNHAGKVLEVKGYNPNSLFRLIEPKTDSGEESEWYSVRQKCYKTIEEIEKNLPEHLFTDRELYNIYINAEEFDKSSDPAWYVGDIRVKSADKEEDNDEGNRILYTVSMEIRADDNLPWNNQYTPIKHEIEDKLTELYFSSDEISIPDRKDEYWRSYVLGKMIFALKGVCSFEDVDALALRREHIIKTKYPWKGQAWLQHPMELGRDNNIQSVSYDFPVEETWADVIKAMGIFSSDDKDNERVVKICMENIDKTIRFMKEDPTFQRDIVSSLKVFDNEKDEDRILSRLSSYLMKMVVAHELGHMTFRSVREDLTLRERESLANWFSCLFADLFNRNFVALLVPYQGEEYQDFIEIPDKYKLKQRQYQNYCTRINSLLRSW